VHSALCAFLRVLSWHPMRNVTLSLPDQTVDRLDRAAEQFLRSRSNLVRAVLEGWLANPETAPLARETLKGLGAEPKTRT
jgi:metal-responsive CopG/Arc/MetJ family transcriptional regulator